MKGSPFQYIATSAVATMLLLSSASAFEGPYVQHSSTIGGKLYGALPKEPFFVGCPEWKAGTPLPISEEQLIKAARTELARLIPDAERWHMSGFDILRFRASQKSLWYFLVYFSGMVTRPDNPQDWKFSEISIPVNFRGQVLPLKLIPE